MSNGYEPTQSCLRRAEQITTNDLIGAASKSVLRAVKERESKPQGGPLDDTLIEILIGLIFD